MKKLNTTLVLQTISFGILFLSFLSGCEKEEEKIINDADGNIYKTIKIGQQEWFAENLKTTKYSDGSSINNVTEPNDWSYLNEGAFSWFKNDFSEYGNLYGGMYNFYAIEDPRGICPSGWRVPTVEDWQILISYLGDNPGGKLKESSTNYWSEPNTDATNEYGFTALPGGRRFSDGSFHNLNDGGYWYSSDAVTAYYIWHEKNTIDEFYPNKRVGLSIRCISESSASLPSVYTSMPYPVAKDQGFVGGVINANGGAEITESGVFWGEEPNPINTENKQIIATNNEEFSSILSNLTPNTKYYICAYACNKMGISYGEVKSFITYANMIEDISGNSYGTIIIGEQEWMAKNLKTTKYSNGDLISEVTSSDLWSINTGGAYCWNENDCDTYGDIYGALYNWYAVNTGNLCPVGWHVPTNSDWNLLAISVGGEYIAGGMLKSVGTIEGYDGYWDAPNNGATNDYGFSAHPAGMRTVDGNFPGVGSASIWWTSNDNIEEGPWTRIIYHEFTQLYSSFNSNKKEGYSVRCIKD